MHILYITTLCALLAKTKAVCLLPDPLKGRSLPDIVIKPRLDGKIVGGSPINITQAPHQISLQTKNGHICGGSILSNQWILTAAHCTYGKSAAALKARLGSSETKSGGELHNISKIVQHEKFNYTNVDYDYSLLQLEHELSFDYTKKAINLPQQNDTFKDDDKCLVTGWGNTKNANETRTWLRQVEVPLVNQEVCSQKYHKYGGVTERMICAGYLVGGKDACQGDSGGPLVTHEDILVGVVSWGYGCAQPDYPGVYSRVSYVRDWIQKHTGL